MSVLGHEPPADTAPPPASDEWPCRIVGLTFEDPQQLLANPDNWHVHPWEQQVAVRGILRNVGWITGVIQNDVTQHLIDGHDRVENAISEGQRRVPVIHVELSEELEQEALATFDTVGLMAGRDQPKLDDLLQRIGGRMDEDLRGLMQHMARVRSWPQLGQPAGTGAAAQRNFASGSAVSRARWTVMFDRVAIQDIRSALRQLQSELGTEVNLTWIEA